MGRTSHSRCVPGLVALCVAASPCIAAASPTIAWDAPEGCPDAIALTAEIARHVDLAAMAPDSASVRVRVREDGERWSVVVAIEADGGALERTLAVESCEAAISAAAFVIAIAIDPARREPPVVPPPPGPAAPSPDAEAPGAAIPAGAGTGPKEVVADDAFAPAMNTPTRREDGLDERGDDVAPPPRPWRRRSMRGLVQIGPAGQVGMLPLTAGLHAATGLLWRRLRLEFGYTRWFAATVRRAGEQPYGGTFSVHAGHARVGPVLRAGPLELPLHVGVELGALRGEGTGGDANYTVTTPWVAAMIGAGLAWAPRALRGHAALIVLAEAALSPHRPRFVFADDRWVHRVGPAAFRGFLVVEARFP